MAPWAVGNFVTVAVRKADGTLVDISADLRTIKRGSPLRATRGRQNETDGIPPGSLEFVLDNSSGAYTPGRSAASCELTLSMPIYVRETLGYRTFDIFSGLLQVPDSVEQLEGIDNLITVTAVDAKQLLDGGRTFVSTLTEYVSYAGRTSLVGHWPMNDLATRCDSLTSGQGPLAQETKYFGPSSFPALPLLQYASLAGPSGDDVSYPQWTVAGDNVTSLTSARLANRALVGATLSSYLVVSLWVLIGSTASSPQTLVLRDDAFVQSIVLDYTVPVLTNSTVWRATVTTAGGSTSLTAGTVNAGGWQCISVRVNTATSVVDLWVDNASASASYVGTLSGSFDSIVVDNYSSASSAGQLQLHVFSASSTYDLSTHLAQNQQGRDGLVYQRTDERIATILGYAAGDNPVALDVGSTFMQSARLAGQKPGQAIDNAVGTERGRYFIGGDGVGRFHSRVRAYNL